MISFGGIYLSHQTFQSALWVERNWPAHEVYEFARLQWPGSLSAAAWSYTPTPLPPVRPGRLHWPHGASRWAVAHYLASEAQLTAIRPLIYTSLAPGKYKALPLVISDGIRSVTADMWMLPARPLATAEDGLKLYLLTLVDHRFFWWQRGADISVVEGATSWEQLYAAVGDALGVTITFDPVASGYMAPALDFTSRYHHLPVLLDAVAWSVGQRIVRKYSGAVLAQSPTSALASVSAQAAYAYPKLAGGLFDMIPG